MIIMIILGTMIGSFLNVCIYRIPEGGSINFPRSHCMKCGHTLGASELIPIFSYLFLGKKCKVCKDPISSRYMWIEILTGVGFGVMYYMFGYSIETVIGVIFLSFAIVLSMIDIDHMILPTSIIVWGIIWGIIIKIAQFIITKDIYVIYTSVVGAIIGYGMFFIVYHGSLKLLKKEALGYGDVRLMGFIGLYLGINYVFIALMIGSVIAAIYGIIQCIIKKESVAYPLGQFLNFGAVITMIFGEKILLGYLSLI